MKRLQFFTGCLLATLLATAGNVLAVGESGQNERIEWQRVANWTIGATARSMVHSLDGKYIFILTDRQQVEVYNSQGQLQGSIPVEAGVAAIDIAPQGELLYLIDNDQKSFTAVAISFVVQVDTNGAPILGPADAPVRMVLFTDFECPYCRNIGPLIEQVLHRNPKTVNLVFKNMPLKFHKMAEPSARAALAAHEQGKFWEYHDRLFAASKLTDELLTRTASELGLDMARFEQDMASPTIRAKIQKDLIDAQKAGVTGTPTIFINGRVPKQRSVEGFQAIIDDELTKLGKK